jgi:cytochrome c551/c552
MNKRILLFALALLGAQAFIMANPIEEGKTIFTSRCAACHNVNKVMTGPALAGLDQRRSIDWIVKFVISSQTMVKNGDKDAVAVFNQFNKIPMPDHPDLTAEHIKSIVEYIKSESKPAGAEKAPFAKPSVKDTGYRPLTLQKDYGFFIAFLVAVVMLTAALVFAVHLSKFRLAMKEQKDSA